MRLSFLGLPGSRPQYTATSSGSATGAGRRRPGTTTREFSVLGKPGDLPRGSMIPMSPADVVVLHALHAPLPALPAAVEGEETVVVRAEILPPVTAEGLLPTSDGRQHRLSDPAALAATLNAQPIDVRVDFDHQSEPVSSTFHDSTAAEGWARSFRANARGGAYRYLSPALTLSPQTREVAGLSSIALTNSPNLPLSAPEVHHMDPTTPTPDDAAQLATREQTAERLLLHAATRAVEQAVAAGQILPAHRDFHLTTIQAHKDGIEAGLTAFQTFLGASADADGVDLHALGAQTLQSRVGPRGAPRPSGTAPAVPVPAGYQPAEDQLALHATIADHAKARGITFRDAAIEFGALTGA